MKTVLSFFVFGAMLAGIAEAEGNGKGTVSGVAVDTQGRPLEGVRIWVKPALTTGLVQVRTGEDGGYHAEGLLNIPYNTFAWYKTTYNDKTVCMRLAPASMIGYDSFVPTDGVVRNFKLRISGPIDDRDGQNYGGELRVFYDNVPRDALVQVRLEPVGPLLDRSMGKVLIKTPKNMMIEDVPVGVYRVTAQIGEQKKPARVSLKNFDNNPAAEVTIAWESKDSCVGSFGSGLDRAYLYIYNR